MGDMSIYIVIKYFCEKNCFLEMIISNTYFLIKMVIFSARESYGITFE